MIISTADMSLRDIATLKAKGAITMGGHKKLKIYGHLNCPNASKWVAKGHYVKQRVFFKSEEQAICNGYRPCGCCMKKEYKAWKEGQK